MTTESNVSQLSRMFAACDDYEYWVIEEVALRAELIWQCKCGNIKDEEGKFCCEFGHDGEEE